MWNAILEFYVSINTKQEEPVFRDSNWVKSICTCTFIHIHFLFNLKISRVFMNSSSTQMGCRTIWFTAEVDLHKVSCYLPFADNAIILSSVSANLERKWVLKAFQLTTLRFTQFWLYFWSLTSALEMGAPLEMDMEILSQDTLV